jgi:hypothetical protein
MDHMTSEPEQITAAQVRAARMLCKRSPIRVCRDVEITKQTLQKAEGERKSITSRYLSSKLRAYYESAGVEFINGDVPSARLKMTPNDDTPDAILI